MPASVFWATPIRACSTCTPTSPCTTPNSAPTSRCWRWTICTPASQSATEEEIAAKIAEINGVFDIAAPGKDKISQPVTDEAMRWSATVAVGLDKLVGDFDLNGLTYYYRGLDGNANEELGATLIVGNSLLTARGIPASGEGDLKTCMAMLIMDRLGAGGSYTEFYAMDFDEDFILMGHDGPGHIEISAGRPVLRGLGLFHGKRGYGLSVEFNVQTGPDHDPGHDADRGRAAQAAGGRGRVDPRQPAGDRQHQLAAALWPGPGRPSWIAGASTGRPTMLRWAWATSSARFASWRACSTWSWRSSGEKAQSGREDAKTRRLTKKRPDVRFVNLPFFVALWLSFQDE